MTSHVRRHHCRYGTSGHVWQGRFRSFIVQKDHHLLQVARYVESNPIRGSLVVSASDWAWSSHGENSGGRLRKVVDRMPVAVKGRWGDYANAPSEVGEREQIRQSISRQTPYGESAWQEQICREFGLESTMRQRGRPRKAEVIKQPVPFY